uniref:Homeobox domain-containing protein n=1 Tax=Ciona savignyi TaxID=51511 RepID=H2YTL5_CIOSA
MAHQSCSKEIRTLNLSRKPKNYEDIIETVSAEQNVLSLVEVNGAKGYIVNISNEGVEEISGKEAALFVSEFRSRRRALGISQEIFESAFHRWTGCSRFVSLKRLEKLDLTVERVVRILPDLKKCLEEAERAKSKGPGAFSKFLGRDLKFRQRKCLDAITKAKLSSVYEKTSNPTTKQIKELSNTFCIAECSINQWFKMKRMSDNKM